MDSKEIELGYIFTDALIEIISTISGFSLNVISQKKDMVFDELTGVMNLNGKKSGLLFISAKELDIRMICAHMTGVLRTEVSETETEDLLCELVNMTAGSAKLRLSNTDFTFALSQPVVLKGESMSLVAKKRTHVVSRVIGNEEVSVKLKVVY